jgi:hypothetical protein
MKTNTKGKTVAPSKKASAKKADRRNNLAPRASTERKKKPAGKPSVKSPEKKGKKSAISTKTPKEPLKVRKKLGAGPAQSAKKASAKKAPAKSPKTAAKTVKKKAAPPKTETVRKTTTKIALPKTSPTARKSSPKTKSKIAEKIKAGKTAVTKKIGGRPVKQAASRQLRKVSSPTKARERKSPSRIKDNDEIIISRTQLPEEYGENELIVMAVDPDLVFVDWEIKKEEAPEAKDGFTMRVFDVTGSESAGLRGDGFFDIKIEGRVGCGFFELGMPGREVAFEIGSFDKGMFMPILRSQVVSMPRRLVADELGIARKLFESGIPLGY